ncbi:SurA N-terminal domain-containing protein [Ancylobacter amanitiformis]|uniref:Peptidyl-prolyl cis-trans isomerase SurA n=1 Tax=Ancylobacter amanitiformis TaxID=217069 RepID=A0ABU0LN89_9HYPH|nr:SurA N-terminal domain-containing protein [Ancylobacter amanitiformis]MDQ0510160.1 peptidyl-prolyl cis-trans isomerase SurA [Ancylobacter amanitiformis]
MVAGPPGADGERRMMRDMLKIACRRGISGPRSERRSGTLARVVAPLLLAGALALPVALSPSPAAAQQILVMVQGQPITNFDVSQRIKLDQLTERRSPSQKQALDELIDERLKIFTAQRYGITADDDEINKMFTQMASRGGRTADQLTQALAQSGITATAMKQKMRADYVWNSYVRGRFSSATTVRDSDIFAELQTKGEDITQAQRTTEFTIRQIVLVVSRTAPDSVRGQRLAEANELRRKFTDCDTGVGVARGMREVVVREPVVRTSADMSAPVRKVMSDTPVGQTTPPEVTRAGIEMVAICNRREVVGESAQKKEVRSQLQDKQFDSLSKRLLEEARRSSMIQYR